GVVAAPEVHFVTGVEAGIEAVAAALAVAACAAATGTAVQLRQQAGTALAQLGVGLQQTGRGAGQIEVAAAGLRYQLRQLGLLVLGPPACLGPDQRVGLGIPLPGRLDAALGYGGVETAAGQQAEAEGQAKGVSSPH